MDTYKRFRTASTQDLDVTQVITVRREATPETSSTFDAVAELSLKGTKKKGHQVFPIELFGQGERGSCLPIERSQTSLSILPFISRNTDNADIQNVPWKHITQIPPKGQYVGEHVTAITNYQRRSTNIQSGDIIRVTGQTNDLWLSGVVICRSHEVTFPVTILEEYQNEYSDESEKICVPPRFENESQCDRMWERLVYIYVQRANWFLFTAWIALIIALIGVVSLSYVPQNILSHNLQQTICSIINYNYESLNQRVTNQNKVLLKVNYPAQQNEIFESSFQPKHLCEGIECTQQIFLDRQFQCYYDERDPTYVQEHKNINISSSVTGVLGVWALVLALTILSLLGKCITLSGCFCPLLYALQK